MQPEEISPPGDTQLQRALALYQSGQLADAAAQFRALLQAFPDDCRVLNGLGTIALQLGDFEEGVRLLGKSLQISPAQPTALSNRAVGLRALQRLDEALASYDRALALRPDYADAHVNRGIALQELGRFDEALAGFERAVALQPGHAGAHYNRGVTLQRLGRTQQALESYDRALTLNPDQAEAHNNHGTALRDLGRPQEALASYERALALRPAYADAWYNRGVALQRLGRFEDAVASYDRALAIKPDHAEAWNNRGSALKDLRQFALALASYDRALILNPDYAEAHYNRGNALEEMGRLDEALAGYDRALTLRPDYADPYWNKALLKLLKGEFAQGWRLFEWRWKGPLRAHARNFTQPLWLGDASIAGKTLLVHAEQGLGDAIQFCRYVPLAEALRARVVLEVPPPLKSLVSTLSPNVIVIGSGDALPDFDLHCPIMSLPLAFGTTVASIPATVPYLHAAEDKALAWQRRLGRRTNPRVGLLWSGSATHRNDQNRSIPLQRLAPLLQLSFEFHAMQKEFRRDDTAVLAQFPQIRQHAERLADFSDTAALIEAMDLVISVDTAVAHLAGALAKTVWILLPFAPDYRWLLERSDSPWYPSATLFRQPARDDWASVVATVAHRLEALKVD